MLDTSTILCYNTLVNEFCAIPPYKGHGLRSMCGAIHLRT